MNYSKYNRGIFLKEVEDMTKVKYDAYQVDDEIHLKNKVNLISIRTIAEIQQNPDKFIWTPFAEFINI